MKNIILGLIATTIISFNSFGQTLNLDQYLSANNQTTTVNDNLFKSYLTKNSADLKSINYDSKIVILQLKNKNFQLIDLTLLDNKLCNHAYIMFNKTTNSFSTFFMNISKTVYEVYGTDFEKLYQFDISGAKPVFTIGSNSKFGACFAAIQDRMCDDGVGTIAWYTNPQLAIIAAIYCSISR